MKIKPDSTWKELPIGGVIDEGGTADEYATGGWRAFKPIWNKEKCIHCLRCWIHCPDSSIIVENGKVVGIDYAHCKGCGICDAVCPAKVDAIEMVKEDAGEEGGK